MLYFPQLSTGSVAQYPIQKRRAMRTVVNEAADGTRYKLADTNAPVSEWSLGLRTLTDAERATLTQFHASVEGRLADFTFLDPTDNLLCWSETLDQSVWEGHALFGITAGAGDPLGGANANTLSNTSAGALTIQQEVSGPGWFQYAFGMQARSAQAQQVTLIRSTLNASQSAGYDIGPAWTRIVLSGEFTGTDEGVTFGIQVQPGQSVDLFGIQVEAQRGLSGYKKTLSNCGVYPKARFLDDALSIQADGPEQHSCLIRIHTRA